MSGNVKALTPDEMLFILDKYQFESSGGYVLVKANNRSTAHPADKGFSLLLPLERKRVKISPKAIALWKEKFLEKYTLIEVQNAINTLMVTLQNTSESAIESQLKRAKDKLKLMTEKGE